MIEEHSQDDDKRAHSVPLNDAQIDTDKHKGLSVAASPFNPVKLELGYLLIVGVLLMLVIHRITESFWQQLLILLIFGVASMLRLVRRTRQIAAQQKQIEQE